MLCVVVVYLQFWMGKMRDVTPAALDDIYIHTLMLKGDEVHSGSFDNKYLLMCVT